jgi:hypothetical protein
MAKNEGRAEDPLARIARIYQFGKRMKKLYYAPIIVVSLTLMSVLMLPFASSLARAQSAGKAGTPASGATSSSAETPTLDYELFKTRVEPIFLKKRPTHGRC